MDALSLPFASASCAPWDGRYTQHDWSAAAATPPPYHHQQQHQGYGGAAPAASLQPFVFHTTESLLLESPPSSGGNPSLDGFYYQAAGFSQGQQQQQQQHPQAPQWVPAPPTARAQAPQLPGHFQAAAAPVYMQQLEQQNSELARRCTELQEQLAGAAAERESSASPATSTRYSRQQSAAAAPPEGGIEIDRDELARLQRRFDSKQREAEAAATAMTAKQQQVAQKEAELEEEKRKAAILADQVAHWRDECTQRERDLRALQQRLEAASSHAGMLEDGGAALKKKHVELTTALAQRDVTIRQLEDRMRAVQGSEGSKDRQLEAAHSENEALRREGAALRQHNGALQAEVERLDTGLAQAMGQVAALQSRTRELEAAVEAGKATSQSWPGPATSAAAGGVPSGRGGAGSGSTAGRGGVGDHTPPTGQWGPTQQQQQQQQQQLLYHQPMHQYPAYASTPRRESSEAQGAAPDRYGMQYAEHGWPAGIPPGMSLPSGYQLSAGGHQEQPWVADLRGSMQQLPYAASSGAQLAHEQRQGQELTWKHAQRAPVQEPTWQHAQQGRPQDQHVAVHASLAEGSLPRGALQRYNHPASAAPPGLGHSRYASQTGSADEGSEACSLSSYPTARPATARPATFSDHWQAHAAAGSGGGATATPHQQQHQQRVPAPSSSSGSHESGGAQRTGTPDALATRLGNVTLSTHSSVSSPYATEGTLQDMLRRTQALEDHLLSLNAEKNELEAETSRMPSHTSGRTLHERKRRVEVEKRLEIVNRECSSVRLQLRRLGVK